MGGTAEAAPRRKIKAMDNNESDERKRQRKAIHAENQRAYVRRRQTLIESLDTQVDCLAKETARLEGQLGVLLSRPVTTFNQTRSEVVVRKYVDMFKHGYQPNHPTQAKFVRTIMREDVRSNGITGVSKFLETFRTYCSVIPNFSMDFVSSHFITYDDDGDCIGTCVVQAMISQRVTRALLSLFFPNVLYDEDLVQRLIGRRLDVLNTSHFSFDANGSIIENSSSMEIVQAFVALVQDVEVAASIVKNNRLHPRHYIQDSA